MRAQYHNIWLAYIIPIRGAKRYQNGCINRVASGDDSFHWFATFHNFTIAIAVFTETFIDKTCTNVKNLKSKMQ